MPAAAKPCRCPVCRHHREQQAPRGDFTLYDASRVLTSEHFHEFHAAIDRAVTAPWSSVPWQLFDPRGQLAAHNPTAGAPA